MQSVYLLGLTCTAVELIEKCIINYCKKVFGCANQRSEGPGSYGDGCMQGICNVMRGGPISNGDAIDTLRERMMDIVADPTKVLSEDFMMNMFIKYVDALPPFKEYWEHLYENKRMRVMAAESGATVLQFAELKERALPSK